MAKWKKGAGKKHKGKKIKHLKHKKASGGSGLKELSKGMKYAKSADEVKRVISRIAKGGIHLKVVKLWNGKKKRSFYKMMKSKTETNGKTVSVDTAFKSMKNGRFVLFQTKKAPGGTGVTIRGKHTIAKFAAGKA